MPAKNKNSSIKSNGSAVDTDGNSIEMKDRRSKPRYRLSAEIDEPLLRDKLLRNDEGAVIHDDISSLDDSDDSGDFPDETGPPKDDSFMPRRMSISQPAKLIGRTGDRFRDLKNFNATGGFLNENGMNLFVTSLFIIGETAGGGLVALPTVMAHLGIVLGTLLIVMGAFICGYSGVQLSECWSIMMIRYPKYRWHTHKPYPAIGRRACGRKTGIAVSLILNVTQFGTAVVFLLLGSKNIASFILFASEIHISFCAVICVVAVLMFPLILLRSPKDFWIPIMVAMCTTTAACILLIYGAWKDSFHCMPVNKLHDFDMAKVLQSFGTIMFAYGGHGAFPTIQHDMIEPHKFEKAVTGAFTGIACLYLPVSIAGALVYGSSLVDIVIVSIQDPWIQQIINLLITAHVFLALTIVFNPMNQDFEQIFNVPDEFTYKRIVVRAGVLLAVVCMALTIPNFGPLLDLVGASTITTMAIILPPLFSLYLNARLSKFGTKGSHLEPLRLSDLYSHNRLQKFVLNILCIIVGIICGCASSYMAITSMMDMQFQRPCYADFFFKSDAVDILEHADDHGIPLTQKFLCCGPARNVSSPEFGPQFCLDINTVSSSGSHG
ncbi:hypothetical protein PFISCL1PPCAC_26989 [Pristionchus fissidentatus]|uniref:Amino acid transporter transmembrane domain-containing protein n=1 Tax=Pristionchus fissidentatus TaxID=1538716 RepID=A0AAV5WUK5_9BILA|nr:hypothetical protein PFISCL1PPCAC_26989 [Pristionchus fissidentatus]